MPRELPRMDRHHKARVLRSGQTFGHISLSMASLLGVCKHAEFPFVLADSTLDWNVLEKLISSCPRKMLDKETKDKVEEQ